jgi:exodeoxyribonuclease V gamma subunit
MAFRLYRSNRVERLAEALTEVVRIPLSSPFSRECIVVQGPGMERWLSAFLAERLTVWANPWFPFPRTIVELLLTAVVGGASEEARWYAPEMLAFRIARVLPQRLPEPAFRALADYLANDPGNERLLAVSGELAHAFDQCMVYRPEQILRWEAGLDHDPHDDLHARLWRSLKAEAPGPHLAERLRAFHQALARGASGSAEFLSGAPDRFRGHPGQGLPERITLFGVSAIPPAFLSLFAQTAQHIDVHLFMLTPSPEYWGDFDAKLSRGQDLHALLAALGKVSRDLGEQLQDVAPAAEIDLFALPGSASGIPDRSRDQPSPERDTMLAGLQADLLTLAARGKGPGLEAPRNARGSDDSLSVHVCHSELRELEVLRDQIRARLERDATLLPHDFVVLAPSIERYAPFIHAVFARNRDDDPSFIPYHVADRKASQLSAVGDALLTLLALARTRLGLSDVLDLLHLAPVRRRFSLSEEELDVVEDWLREAGARWAIDAEHRAQFKQPPFEENTLSFALSRLLVGYAARAGERSDVFGSLPLGDAEGRDALPLGKLARFLRTLFELTRELSNERSMHDWVELTRRALTQMISDEDELGSEHLSLRTNLAAMADAASAAGFAAPLSLPAFERALVERLDQRRSSASFLSGGVTFCEHVPMRAIPSRVICLLGMDDESFPRRARRNSFDVLTRAPRPGDRTLRDDDRQIFLESLLSARDALHISYVGRSAKDDTPRPASVLVERLLSVVDRHFVLASEGANLRLDFGTSPAASITHVHALHRFDPRYFSGTRESAYFSYDDSACAASRALLSSGATLRSFAPAPLVEREAPRTELALESLVRFYRAPPRAFLEQRLGVFLPRTEDETPDREPTALSGLSRFRLMDELLRDLFDAPDEERRRLLRQAGKLPPGTLGDVALSRIERDVAAVKNAVPSEGDERELRIDLDLGSLRLTGRIADVGPERRVERIIATARAKHILVCWIRHLALCASEPRESVLVSRDAKKGAEICKFVRVSDARAQLIELCELRNLGLAMPLPLFLQAGFDAVSDLLKHQDVARARGVLEGSFVRSAGRWMSSESEDSYVRQIWSERELARAASLTVLHGEQRIDAFELARRLFLPLLTHMRAESES